MVCSQQNACVLTATLLLLAVASPEARAVEVTTDPVGFTLVELAGSSDSYLYVPFKRPAALIAPVIGIEANELYDEGEPFVDVNDNGQWDEAETFTDTLNVLGLPEEVTLQQDQFVYSPGAQTNQYYVLVRSGSQAGICYPVVSNGPTAIVIDNLGNDLSTIIGQITIEVIPYDTLGTVFPSGQGVHASISHAPASRRTLVFLPNHDLPGKNIAFDRIYYYFSGANPGWRKVGAPTVVVNDTVLPPDSFFFVRHNIPTPTTHVFTGNVLLGKFATPVNTLAPNQDQDNFVAAPIPVEVRLRDLDLVESEAFVGSASHAPLARQDLLLVWDNATLGINRASDSIYYYYSPSSGVGAGWRKAGTPLVPADDDVVMSSSRVFVIRKKATSSASSSLWTVSPTYVPAETP